MFKWVLGPRTMGLQLQFIVQFDLFISTCVAHMRRWFDWFLSFARCFYFEFILYGNWERFWFVFLMCVLKYEVTSFDVEFILLHKLTGIWTYQHDWWIIFLLILKSWFKEKCYMARTIGWQNDICCKFWQQCGAKRDTWFYLQKVRPCYITGSSVHYYAFA